MVKIIRVIFSSLTVHMKLSFARPTFKFIVLLQPMLYSLLLYLMFRNSETINIGEYIIVGTGILNLWSSIIFSSSGDIERERFMGTLESLYVTPSDFRVIFLGKVLGNVVLGLSSMLISYICINVIFQVKVSINNVGLFLVSFLLTIISFTAISLLLALLFTLSRNSRMLMNCMEYPIYILCGITFPVSLLPEAVQFLSGFLSPTWAVKTLRGSMVGINDYEQFSIDLLMLLLLTIFYLVLVQILFKSIDRNTRIKGNLGVY
ncbi:hypothetical protein ABD76_09380 [Paenibacillus dendritiformis]|uniref:ABC transporter permease n=1 Tax=Paenibacillus dendritiformis TaxID=130049 RepID=UPI0018CE9D03|nr:ABC transporter permease [Paenibacillus dendritiformis]MBG9792692.1 hypothetical protein [Paenibacillus dendritiformis]